ncbi:general secretion pathway protein J [Solimonas aquatica]|uniref:Type II secretion system protein J n=1 Tax=Solimonas aquatica TaxID=489703 RepID=A0A1H9HU32_9GAMM|nr:type II secretion system minor pseudopilin GspJ [Solimonas aquatica]SEQ65831.1 general secretion pathway protein J [Solimonas aquatica]
MKRATKTFAQSGFTLLEMLVVVAIFAIFAVLAYGGLNSVLKTRAAVERGQQELAQVQKAYLRLRDDLQQVQPRPVRDNYGDLQPAFYANREGDLELTRGGWRNPLLLPRSSLQRVSYHLAEDGLHRRSWRGLDRAQDDKPQDVLLLAGVSKVGWRFLDEQAQWQTQWPPLNAVQGTTPETQLPAPPVAAEITLRTRSFGELHFLFRLGLDPRKQDAEPPPPGPNQEPPAQLPRGDGE